MRILLATAVACVLALASSAAAAALHEDMVALDRAYVPALSLTNQPKTEPAQRALARLRAEWNRFRSVHDGAPAGFDQAAWAKHVSEVESAIHAAEVNLAGGKGAAAHEDLERVRESQLALRRGAGVGYFMDDLTHFHEAMEKIAGPATARTAATLTDADVAAIAAALPQAERAWQSVLMNRAQAAKHGLAPDVEQQVQRDIEAETQLLAELKAALASGDRGRIAEKAMATKPAFSKLFQRFGDYAGLR